jgi:Flp pilus assembly pilin Flp
MKKVMNYIDKLKTKALMMYVQGQEGVVTIEYVLIGALVAVALIVTFTFLADEIRNLLNRIIAALQNA